MTNQHEWRADYPGNYYTVEQIRKRSKPIEHYRIWRQYKTSRHRFEINTSTGMIYCYSIGYGRDYYWSPKRRQWIIKPK